MKVLMLVPYLFLPEISGGDRNVSGLAYMNRSIADAVGELCDLYVYTQSYFIPTEQKVSSFRLIQKRPHNLLNRWTLRYQLSTLQRLIRHGYDLRNAARNLYYAAGASYAEKVIRSIRPDALFIHSISGYTIPFLLASARTGVSTAVVLHGLISLDKDIVAAKKGEADFEIRLLAHSESAGYRISMISSGMKRRVEEQLGIDCSKIKIISNFTDLAYEQPEGIRLQKHIEAKQGAILCIGTLYPLKNQSEVILAYAQLPGDVKENHPLLVIGDGPDLAELKKLVQNRSIKNVFFTGRVAHKDLMAYYSSASLVVLASLAEGFGLPVLEGYWFGVPSVMFADLDAYKDLSSSASTITPKNRETNELCKAMYRALIKKWDKKLIINQARVFSSKKIAVEYMDLLKDASGPITMEVFNDA